MYYSCIILYLWRPHVKYCRALFDIGDVSDDIREHTMRAGEEIGNGVARSFKVFWRKTTMFVRRAFGYDR